MIALEIRVLFTTFTKQVELKKAGILNCSYCTDCIKGVALLFLENLKTLTGG